MIDTDNTVLFATRNPGKVREFRRLLGDFINPGWRVLDIDHWPGELAEVVEDKDTFWANAVKKAFEVSRATGSVAIADDSGLEVDALDGRPGVYSARFAGEDATDAANNQKLVAELDGVADARRGARYVSVVAVALPENQAGRALLSRTGLSYEAIGAAEPAEPAKMVRRDDRILVWFRGTVEGRIIDEPRGDHGFGYDPHFLAPRWNKTMAEVSMDQKNTISHRAEALEKVGAFFSGNP